MGFINSILTDEEKEMFKERAIPYPSEIWWRRGDAIGYEPYRKQEVTLDREGKIYLFECENHPNFDEMDDYHFSFIWDELFGNSQVSFHLKKKILLRAEYDIEWKMQKMNFSNNINVNIELIYNKLKEALCVYGLNGDPDSSECYKVKFDF